MRRSAPILARRPGIESVGHVVTVRSGAAQRCVLGCRTAPLGFDDLVNHLLAHHGYRLLHVGPESSGDDRHPRSVTVAVLGH